MRSLEKRPRPRVALTSLVGLLALGLICAGSLQASLDGDGLPTKVDRLRAFTKVYGYTRFFHPSDEAAKADWEKLAIDGAARVMGMTEEESLGQVLLEIFRPVAPSMQIVGVDEEAGSPFGETLDGSADVVAWQHKGVGVNNGNLNGNVYMSVRSNRDNFRGLNPDNRGFINQTIAGSEAASELRGKEIRLRFAARVETARSAGFPLGWGTVGLAVSRENGLTGFYDGMEDRPITDPEWNRYEITGTIDEDATGVYLWALLDKAGAFWLDAFECEVRDPGGSWEPVELVNPGFEISPPLSGWERGDVSYRYAVDKTQPFEGRASGLIANEPTDAPDQLFSELPALGESIEKEIGCGLKVILPLALPIDTVEGDATYSAAGDVDTDVTATRIAAVVVAWNVFQHFYPYFDVVEVDWDEELTIALTGALEAQSEWEFFGVLRKLTAALQDGHIYLYHPYLALNRALLPIQVDWIEGQVVVTASRTPYVLPGDVVVEMDGRPAEEIMEEAERYISGSPQWKRYRSGISLAIGARYSEAALTVLRDGEEIQVNLERTVFAYVPYPRPDRITEIADGIYYVNLTQADQPEIEQAIDELASATGVIFDMRGIALLGADHVIEHMIDDEVLSAIWNVPLAIYPDRENLGWNTSGRWSISAHPPRIEGKIVFLTDASVLSYGESVMGIIEAYKLAEIVGRPTAGTNGNVNDLPLPGGYVTSWTGMKVLKHDGSQHHLIGILPTVPVERTIAAIREGRDEDLETAIRIIQVEQLP